MFKKIRIMQWCRQTIIMICVISLVIGGLPLYPQAYADISSQSNRESERTRTNNNTQIRVGGPSGASINTWNGSLSYAAPLLTIPSRSLPIQLTLGYYSSLHNFASRYGFGWQLNYDMYYVRGQNGDVVVVWEQGGGEQFIKSGGSFLSPRDAYESFWEYQPGKYVLRTKAGVDYYFDNPIHKRVTRRQDPNGNRVVHQ
jgi:hypothetical protein